MFLHDNLHLISLPDQFADLLPEFSLPRVVARGRTGSLEIETEVGYEDRGENYTHSDPTDDAHDLIPGRRREKEDIFQRSRRQNHNRPNTNTPSRMRKGKISGSFRDLAVDPVVNQKTYDNTKQKESNERHSLGIKKQRRTEAESWNHHRRLGNSGRD